MLPRIVEMSEKLPLPYGDAVVCVFAREDTGDSEVAYRYVRIYTHFSFAFPDCVTAVLSWIAVAATVIHIFISP
jgi:hypothetical protein